MAEARRWGIRKKDVKAERVRLKLHNFQLEHCELCVCMCVCVFVDCRGGGSTYRSSAGLSYRLPRSTPSALRLWEKRSISAPRSPSSMLLLWRPVCSPPLGTDHTTRAPRVAPVYPLLIDPLPRLAIYGLPHLLLVRQLRGGARKTRLHSILNGATFSPPPMLEDNGTLLALNTPVIAPSLWIVILSTDFSNCPQRRSNATPDSVTLRLEDDGTAVYALERKIAERRRVMFNNAATFVFHDGINPYMEWHLPKGAAATSATKLLYEMFNHGAANIYL